VHDLSANSAAGFRGYLERSGAAGRIAVHDDPERLIRTSDMVVFATVAAEPHVSSRDSTCCSLGPEPPEP
jgi:N-[(2S)-2-amino-2-carboxyethyl]-L-glutamate dehydrogenase